MARASAIAVQHGIDDVVDRAGADGVVGRVAHNLAPSQVEQAGGVRPQRAEKSAAKGLGPALQLALGQRPPPLHVTRFEVTPMSMLARAPERSSPWTRTRSSVVVPSSSAPER